MLSVSHSDLTLSAETANKGSFYVVDCSPLGTELSKIINVFHIDYQNLTEWQMTKSQLI